MFDSAGILVQPYMKEYPKLRSVVGFFKGSSYKYIFSYFHLQVDRPIHCLYTVGAIYFEVKCKKRL